ncbi:uncharacterized protein BX663DRAFT_524575 [Cokeromyces recurvatus]|uniref:uncharacterized protein n=1 Tax=Cokeromyces recurvatus TaxID=90255 RepID=UPI00221EA231|nr:uncharacterized protein BX663DRAFT_524575 [Cokeromyces recurvatus]KAI7898555.1 hypothetical protein BX663DRAFT_524575 [Cokeromyces recurvatus]
MMIELLPNELLETVLYHLTYEEVETLLESIPKDTYSTLAQRITGYLKHQYPFQTALSVTIQQFEQTCLRQQQDTHHHTAQQLLALICEQAEPLPPYDRRSRFTELLDIVQRFILQRVLYLTEHFVACQEGYARLCLLIRDIYLHTPSIRVLHDPKYRRRSTKYPLAPFLPRDYSYMWRENCNEKRHQGFALFFGRLFDVTSLYLESNLEGTFEECIREGLVTGHAEDVLMLCVAANREVDVEGMSMMVSLAGEQLRHYLDTMEHWIAEDPTPQQELRIQQQQQQDIITTSSPPPDWLIPDRYRVHPDTKFRLKVRKRKKERKKEKKKE